MELPVIFLDVDGTILPHDKVLPDATKQAIQKYVASNGRVHLITGRVTGSIVKLIDELGLSHLTHGGANGGMIYKNNEHIVHHGLGNHSKIVIDVLNDLKLNFFIYYKDYSGFVANGDYERDLELIERIKEPYPIFETTHAYSDVIKILIALDEHTLVEEEIKKRLNDIEGLRVIRTGPKLLEFHDEKMEKVEAVRYILEGQNHKTMAIGDSENDLSMLSYVDYPKIVANANPILMGRGFEMVPSCDDCGVAFVINRLLEGDIDESNL